MDKSMEKEFIVIGTKTNRYGGLITTLVVVWKHPEKYPVDWLYQEF